MSEADAAHTKRGVNGKSKKVGDSGDSEKHGEHGKHGVGKKGAQKSAKAETDLSAAEAVEALGSCYMERYRMPPWVPGFVGSREYEKYAPQTILFHSASVPPDLAFKLASQREPTNLAMARPYDAERMRAFFGYSHGGYERLGGHNIAMYCKTPFYCGEDKKLQRVDLHVVNLIAPALDDAEQPDYQALVRHDGTLDEGRYTEALYHALSKGVAALKVLRQTTAPNMRRIVYCGIGQGAFSGGFDTQKCFAEAYATLLANTWKGRRNAGICIDFLAFNFEKDYVAEAFRRARLKLRKPGASLWARQFVGNVHHFPLRPDFHPEHTLLVNAADPWSVMGNGNGGDRSYDGIMGRRTAIGALCWPPSNPWFTVERTVAVKDDSRPL